MKDTDPRLLSGTELKRLEGVAAACGLGKLLDHMDALQEQIRQHAEVCKESAFPLGRPDEEALAAVPQLRGKNAVVLYFDTDQDREEFVALIHEAKPGMRTVNI